MRAPRTSSALIAVLMAVCLGIFVSCIATKRDVADLQAQHDQIVRQNKDTQKALARMDSIMAAGADADRKLRNDLQVTVSDLQVQISHLLQNYSDLMQRLDKMGEVRITTKPTSSPGAQDSTRTPDTTAAAPAPVTQTMDCDSLYDAAFQLMHDSKYNQAMVGYQALVANCPTNRNVPDARYWTGECLFSMEKFQDALDTLQSFLKGFPSSVHVRQALYKVGRCQQELKHKSEARKTFQQVIKQYPETQEAENSKDRLKELK